MIPARFLAFIAAWFVLVAPFAAAQDNTTGTMSIGKTVSFQLGKIIVDLSPVVHLETHQCFGG